MSYMFLHIWNGISKVAGVPGSGAQGGGLQETPWESRKIASRGRYSEGCNRRALSCTAAVIVLSELSGSFQVK